MQWFKHFSNFRNSPAMKFMAEQLGDHGVAGVYRLYEVFAERFAINNDFSGSLVLSPPFTEHWLAQEVLTPHPAKEANSYHPTLVPLEQLTEFLQTCHLAGIIQLDHVSDESSIKQPDGTFKGDGVKRLWTVVTIPEFAALADEYSVRKRKGKGLETTR
jgi:hypothetical protein